MCLEMAVSCLPAGGESAPGSSLCCVWPVLWAPLEGRGSVTTYTLPRSFSSVAGVGCPKLTWLRKKASSLEKPGSRGVPLAVGNPPLASFLLHAIFPFSIRVSPMKKKNLTHGDPQVPIVGRPPYLNQSSYRSLGPIAGRARLQNRTWSFRLIRLLQGWGGTRPGLCG